VIIFSAVNHTTTLPSYVSFRQMPTTQLCFFGWLLRLVQLVDLLRKPVWFLEGFLLIIRRSVFKNRHAFSSHALSGKLSPLFFFFPVARGLKSASCRPIELLYVTNQIEPTVDWIFFCHQVPWREAFIFLQCGVCYFSQFIVHYVPKLFYFLNVYREDFSCRTFSRWEKVLPVFSIAFL